MHGGGSVSGGSGWIGFFENIFIQELLQKSDMILILKSKKLVEVFFLGEKLILT